MDDGRTAHKAGNEPRRKAPIKAQGYLENGIGNARKATTGTDVSRICTEVHNRKRTQDDGGRVKRADGVPWRERRRTATVQGNGYLTGKPYTV